MHTPRRALRTGLWIGLPMALGSALLLYRRARRSRVTIVRSRLPLDMSTAITIQCGADELYAWWRDFTRLPTIMRHVESVERLDHNRWRWVARLPVGERRLQWESEVTEERPGELLRWRSLPGSDVAQAGELRFVPAPAGRGTELHARIAYRPGGTMATTAARLFHTVTEQLIREELRHFKELMETGEIPTIEGQPAG